MESWHRCQLPNWHSLPEETKHHILSLEEDKAKEHKEWEEWKSEHQEKDKKPDAVALAGDRSGLKQMVMFKSRLLAMTHILRKSYHARHDLGERGHIAFTRRVESGKLSLISAKGLKKIKERTERQNYSLHKPRIKDLPTKDITSNMILPEAKSDSFAEKKWYINKFLAQFGGKFGLPVQFTDKAGELLTISESIFHDKEESRKAGKAQFKVTKRGREKYLLLLADTIKNPTEIWIHKATPLNMGERRYISIYRDSTGKVSGYAVFHLRNGEWKGTTTYSPEALSHLDSKRQGKLVYIAEKPPLIKAASLPAFKSPHLGARPSYEVSGTSNITLSPTREGINNPLNNVKTSPQNDALQKSILHHLRSKM